MAAADHAEVVQAGEARNSGSGTATGPAPAWHKRLHLSDEGVKPNHFFIRLPVGRAAANIDVIITCSIHIACDTHLADVPHPTAAVTASHPQFKDIQAPMLLQSAGVLHHCNGCCLVSGWKAQVYMLRHCNGCCLVFGWKLQLRELPSVQECWSEDPSKRPGFEHVIVLIRGLLEGATSKQKLQKTLTGS